MGGGGLSKDPPTTTPQFGPLASHHMWSVWTELRLLNSPAPGKPDSSASAILALVLALALALVLVLVLAPSVH